MYSREIRVFVLILGLTLILSEFYKKIVLDFFHNSSIFEFIDVNCAIKKFYDQNAMSTKVVWVFESYK